VRLFLKAFAFALACAATLAAQSGRVKRAEPAAQPSPERRQEAAQKEGLLRLVKGDPAADDDAEPERDEEGNRVYLGRQVDRRARLLSRPEPDYTRRARRNRVRGRVVLRAVLAASGKVERVTVVKRLPDGLTEEAIKAARAIKFEPAERDGRKVSQSVVIEYHFDVY
jgi:TonB family protein